MNKTEKSEADEFAFALLCRRFAGQIPPVMWRSIDYAESDYDHQTDFDRGRYFLLRCDNKHAKKTRLDDPYHVVFIQFPESLSEEICNLNIRYPMEPVTHYLEIIGQE